MPVRFGVEIPHRPELLGPVATRAEALGFDSVWIGAHVAFHGPTLDSLGDELARKYCLLGPPAACVERLGEFVDAGVRTFVMCCTVPAERVLEQLERFAAEVLSPVTDRTAPGAGSRVAWRS